VAYGLGEHLLADAFYQFAQARESQLPLSVNTSSSIVHLSATPPLGMSLGERHFAAYGVWAAENLKHVEQARRKFDNRAH